MRDVPQSAFEAACLALFPWHGNSYPGIGRGIADLCKAPFQTARDWRRGKRKAPQWACDVLIAEARKRAAALLAAAEKLENESQR
jgi:hypothetical protein